MMKMRKAWAVPTLVVYGTVAVLTGTKHLGETDGWYLCQEGGLSGTIPLR